jgi:hypothetical protein
MAAITCSKCHRAVFDTDVNKKGECVLCGPSDPPKKEEKEKS